jgi:hypothetical protein
MKLVLLHELLDCQPRLIAAVFSIITSVRVDSQAAFALRQSTHGTERGSVTRGAVKDGREGIVDAVVKGLKLVPDIRAFQHSGEELCSLVHTARQQHKGCRPMDSIVGTLCSILVTVSRRQAARSSTPPTGHPSTRLRPSGRTTKLSEGTGTARRPKISHFSGTTMRSWRRRICTACTQNSGPDATEFYNATVPFTSQPRQSRGRSSTETPLNNENSNNCFFCFYRNSMKFNRYFYYCTVPLEAVRTF